MKYLGFTLVIVHGFLLLWSTGGFLEMILAEVPWKPFTNSEFPTWVLIIHWSSVMLAAVSFLYGYFKRLSITPRLMAIAYGFMALVCVIETFGYMTSKMKYLAMGTEFLTYGLILFILFKSKFFKDYFSKIYI